MPCHASGRDFTCQKVLVFTHWAHCLWKHSGYEIAMSVQMKASGACWYLSAVLVGVLRPEVDARPTACSPAAYGPWAPAGSHVFRVLCVHVACITSVALSAYCCCWPGWQLVGSGFDCWVVGVGLGSVQASAVVYESQ
jgi:hypothetical protein